MNYLKMLSTLAFCFALGNVSAQTNEQVEKASKLAKKITSIIARIEPSTSLKEVAINWKENSEVKEINQYVGMKKVAAIYSIIKNLEKNDLIIFSNLSGNDTQKVIAIFQRLDAYSLLNTLVENEAEFRGLDDFLSGEMNDIEFYKQNKITYQIYLSEHKRRLDKLSTIYFTDSKFNDELLQIMMDKNSKTLSLSAKTTVLTLFQICSKTLELGFCEKL